MDGSFDAREVRRIVAEAIKVYDADKTGRADYALESAGKLRIFHTLKEVILDESWKKSRNIGVL